MNLTTALDRLFYCIDDTNFHLYQIVVSGNPGINVANKSDVIKLQSCNFTGDMSPDTWLHLC